MNKTIKIESTNKSFSALGGLHLLDKLIFKSKFRNLLESQLPVSAKRGLSSYAKLKD